MITGEDYRGEIETTLKEREILRNDGEAALALAK